MLIPSGSMFSFEGEKTYVTCHQRSIMVCAKNYPKYIYMFTQFQSVLFSLEL